LNANIKKFKKGNIFIKTYPLTSLVCSIQEIELRLTQIKKYINIGFSFNIDSKYLTLNFEYIKSGRPFSILDFNLLGKYLDYIHSENMFHGDIHYRNLMIKDDRIVLIDWEPCFIQIINGKKIIKSHSKGIHPLDKKNKNISKFTDKKGYLNLLKDFLNIREEQNFPKNFLINHKCEDIFGFMTSHFSEKKVQEIK